MSVKDLTDLISPYFNEDIILKIIKVKTGLQRVEDLQIIIDSEASKKGDSYLSTICRFLLRANGLKSDGSILPVCLPVIVKYIPKNAARNKTFRSADFFKTEFQFYTEVWPEMKKIKSAVLPDEPDEVPLYLAGHCDGINDFIALEDLSYAGFKGCSRNDDITAERLLLLLEKLANFHALGIVTAEKNPQFINFASRMDESYFSEKLRSWYSNFMNNSMWPQYQKATKDILSEYYYDKITTFFSMDMYGEAIKSYQIRNKTCSVSEGDAWLPNFLVKSNDLGDVNAVLIDFQLARYGPITNDLLQFLYSGVPQQILLTSWDNFILGYHRCLNKRIEELGGTKNFLSFEEFTHSLKQHSALGLVMAMESTLMSLLNDAEVAELDLLQGEKPHPLENVWILPEFDETRNRRLAFLVKHMIDHGLIAI